MESQGDIIEIPAEKAPVTAVTVYLGSKGAEVTRQIKFKPTEKGRKELVLKGLPPGIMPDHLNVSSPPNTASKSTILEVVPHLYFPTKTEEEEAQEKSMKKDLEDEVEKLLLERSYVDAEKEVASDMVEFLNKWSESVMMSPKSQSKVNSGFMNPQYLESVGQFGSFHQEQLNKFYARVMELTQQIEELDKKIEELRTKIEATGTSKKLGKMEVRLVVVFSAQAVEAADEMEFDLKYFLPNSSWTASYDVRADMTQEKPELVINYYGNVCNKSGEDWKKVKLSLSTVMQSKSTAPEELKKATVCLKELPVLKSKGVRRMAKASGARSRMAMNSMMLDEECCMCECDAVVDEDALLEELDLEDMVVEQATTRKSVAGAIFDIPREATIDNDGLPHRVTIGELRGLEADFSHVIHPANISSAFLLVDTKNTSEMPLIDGPCAAFLDGNYISSTNMPYTATGAKCKLFLGIDRDVAVTYAAPFSVRDKTIPILSRTQVEHVTGNITIKSSKPGPTKVTVRHPAPYSTNESLKVVFSEPPISAENKKINKDGFDITFEDRMKIIWEFELKAGEEKKIPIAYTLEYPKGMSVINA